MIRKIFFSFFLLSLVGFGCSPVAKVSNTEIKDTAESINFQANSSFTIKQTVFGLGGVFAETISGDSLAEYQIIINSFTPNQGGVFSWSNASRQETTASIVARDAYKTANHPVGDQTSAPEVIYETVNKFGVYTTSGLADSTKIFLPAYWAEGEQIFSDNSILWLSKNQYENLVNTKTTTLSLGLFDEKIASLIGMSDSVQNALNVLQQKATDASKSQDIYKLTADNDWQVYSLIVDGVEKTVRTIEASNWFGSYVILANAENPLILKVTLNPFAIGSFDLSSPLSSFLGYEIIEIKTKI